MGSSRTDDELNNKKKVIFILGATGSGKSKLSIDLAVRLPAAEIVNSDKMQVYKGLDIVTNKVSESEQQGVPHHMLSEVDPDSDFTAFDFCRQAISAVERIVGSGRIPIVVGGSNSYIEALVEDPSFNFKSNYEPCFLWVDVSLPVLHSSVSKRVDLMVDAGLVEEVRGIFEPEADYERGIRKSIGVPEMDKYLKEEKEMDESSRQELLRSAIEEIKANTRELVCCQLRKIHRLRDEVGWPIHRLDATAVTQNSCKDSSDQSWQELVLQPSLKIANDFLGTTHNLLTDNHASIISTSMDHPLKNQLQATN